MGQNFGLIVKALKDISPYNTIVSKDGEYKIHQYAIKDLPLSALEAGGVLQLALARYNYLLKVRQGIDKSEATKAKFLKRLFAVVPER